MNYLRYRLEIGNTAKIKSYKEIKSNSDSSFHSRLSFYSNGLLFDECMEQYCGNIVTIAGKKQKKYGTIYRVEENGWWWNESWLINYSDFFLDEDFEI
jgi:hypothetical protein